jgi:PAS domain S-box-containing protein
VQPINQLLKFTSRSGNRRSRIQGVVTLRTPGQLYVQDASGSVVVQSNNAQVRRGDLIEAEGYAAPSDYGPVMNDAAVKVISHDHAVTPEPAEADQILSGTFDSRLVRIKAKVLSNIRGAAQQTLALQNGYTSFNAQIDSSDGLLDLDEGTVIEVTGVCSVQRHLLSRDNSALPVSFRILLRSPEDVRILQEASWWNMRHAWTVLIALVLVICVAFLWVIALRRRVNKQTSVLAHQHSFLRAVLDMCPNFIFVKDRDGRFSLVNRAFAQAWGRQPEDMVGKDDIEVGIDRDQAAAYRRDDEEIITTGREKVVIEPHTDLHGHQLWMHTVKRPLLNERGQPTQVVGVANDITLHKHAEETLQKAREAAETANRAKSEFLANMSHEIRTPLNGIIGMTALWMDTEMTREQREYLETVRVSADGLLTVINDVLDFSKIEAGRFEIDNAEFNLREVLDSAVKTLALRAHQKNLELVCNVAPDVPEYLRGDASRLRQVILNLAGNAIKFTAQGEVVIRVQLQAQDSLSTTLHLSVRDTGIGIDAARHKAIFDPFVQADTSTTRIYGGTGLGLTISSRLVTMMGGKLWLDSELGKGSEFHFTVRMQCVHHASGGDPAAVLADTKMLIVEDSVSARDGLDSLLRRWKVRTVFAANADEAMAALSAAELADDPIQVSLIDVQMPADGGYALIEKIRARPDLSQQIVALLSPTRQGEEEVRCKSVGVQVCLVKPVRAVDLSGALTHIVHDVHAATITQRPRPSASPSAPSAELNILLAEDNLVNQMLMVRLLQKRGHRVTVAANGKIALEQLEREQFDLVLMDVQMPELDGLAAAQEIRRREQLGGRHIPIVALTAHAMSGDRERCLAAGMEGYLTKPINTKELDETLNLYAKNPLANAAAG